MEEKIITAIQSICSKSKQWVTSRRNFRFISKGALSIESELCQDSLNKLEIYECIYKKRGVKLLQFLLILFSQTARKMMDLIAWKEFINLQNYLKTIEKLESPADHDLGNIQNATPSMHLINTPLLYRKDSSCGLSSNVCTEHRFFHKEILF